MPFEENSYVVHLDSRRDCLIVDPGLEPDLIVDYVVERGLSPASILITHGHADHIGGNHALKQQWPDCPIVTGAGEAAKLCDPVLNLSAGYGIEVTSPPADVLLSDGDVWESGGLKLVAREIPGHSEGHLVFIWNEASPIQVFGGDVLFAGSIGRTDFPGGSFQQLARGIHTILFALPADTVVWPGHGPATTVGRERQGNPFVGTGGRFNPG